MRQFHPGWLPLVSALATVGCGVAEPAPRSAPMTLCRSGDPARERHGTDCLCCHLAGEFPVSGSIDPRGSPVTQVFVRDALGQQLEMAPNAHGNFFRHQAMTPPLEAWVVGPRGAVVKMQGTAPQGSCNRCHQEGGDAAPIHGP